jgi:hypothetical protein
MKSVGLFETAVIHYPPTRHNTPEQLFPQQPFVRNVISRFSCFPDENPPQIHLTSVYAGGRD